MASVVFYFQAHQPLRLKNFGLFSINSEMDYFGLSDDSGQNQSIFNKVVEKCYRPATSLLLDLVHQHPDFRFTFSFSGMFLRQLQSQAPDVLETIKALVATGRVELLAETFYHSLASVYDGDEFEAQISLHQQILAEFFDNYKATAFRNTELIYNDDTAAHIESLGFKAILAEGVARYLGDRSANYIYRPQSCSSIKLLLKNFQLSDDIAFRFSNQQWPGWPLTAAKYAEWVSESAKEAQVINIFMDFETFGEHHWKDTGIFEFLRDLPGELFNHPDINTMTVSQAADQYDATDSICMPEFTSWADRERDLSAWIDNPLQQTAAKAIYDIREDILASNNSELIDSWRKMTTSDHFYHMSTKQDSDGEVHRYFSPYPSAFDAFTRYMNVLHDLRQRV